ncbi:leucine-rich repeat-containing protein 74A isoform X1 [Ranitomeya variabilis]|uniref:leucine-rich repeat-containing protein 74A isoform X1 n=1 Tax=Ranitomeya variabilis TaxID=490064 RepID=UPI004055D973
MAALCPQMLSLSLETSEDQYDTDLDAAGSKKSPSEATDGKHLYMQACHDVGVVPASYFLRHMYRTHVDLKHHGLGPRGARALAAVLQTNTSITHLSLEDNWIQAEGLMHLVQVLRENNSIQELDLSDNHLGVQGSDVLSTMLLDNLSINGLNVAHNGFSDLSAKHFAEALSANFRVTKLNLSHNEFCEKGGEYLGQMLAASEGLQELNLSWNHIRMKGAIALSAGLRVNGMLKVLDVSYNGFGNEGALALGEALRVNSSLLHLNISCNRISNEGVRLICKGLESNETLVVLKMSRNPITVEGAITLLNGITKRPENKIEELDISNVLVNEQFLSLLNSASASRPALHVRFAGKKGFVTRKRSARPDPMRIIQDFLDEHKLRLIDFFKNMDKDGSMSIPVSDFCRYMSVAGLPLDAAQMDSLVQRLDKDLTGTIDYRHFVDSRKQMVKEQRKQQRRREKKERQERQRSERALKSFHTAVRALTPPPVFRQAPGSAVSSAHSCVTPCSSWYQEGEPAEVASSLHTQNAGSDDMEVECSNKSHWSLTSRSQSELVTPKRNTPSPPNMK